MNSILQSSMLSLLLLSACTGGIKKPEPETRSKLIKTICGECPCEHIETDGEDVSADCYPPQPKESSNDRYRI